MNAFFKILVILGIILSAILIFNENNFKMVQTNINITEKFQIGANFSMGCRSINGLPDSKCTPGAIDPNVTQSNIADTICVSGYTSQVRPPTSYTTPLKSQLIQAYGYSNVSPSAYELDHLVSLELGGAPYSVSNLWPELHTGTANSFEKDKFENYLHRQVCNGNMTLIKAQQEIATNWYANWTSYGQP